MERAVEFGLLHRSKIKSHNHIHIDEKSVHGRDLASILYDDDGTVLEVVGGRKKEDAKALICKALNPIQRANVLTASIDMWVILGPLAGGALAAGVWKLIDTEK
jgi:hypothetical protein